MDVRKYYGHFLCWCLFFYFLLVVFFCFLFISVCLVVLLFWIMFCFAILTFEWLVCGCCSLKHYCEHTSLKHLFLERCIKSNNIWLCAVMQSDCLYSSLFFEHYNCILLCEWVLGHCSLCLIDGVSCHTHLHFTWTGPV